MTLNAAHIHLMTNHYAIFACFFASAMLLYGMFAGHPALRVASYIMYLSAGVMVVVAYVTGGLAEDATEHVAGILRSAIDPHEEAGKVALALVALAALASLYALLREARGSVSRPVQAAVLALGVAGFLAGGYAALLGGYIHHPEIRAGLPAGVHVSE